MHRSTAVFSTSASTTDSCQLIFRPPAKLKLTADQLGAASQQLLVSLYWHLFNPKRIPLEDLTLAARAFYMAVTVATIYT